MGGGKPQKPTVEHDMENQAAVAVPDMNVANLDDEKNEVMKPTIEFSVKTYGGRPIVLKVKSDSTVHHLKECIMDKTGRPVEQQKLIFAGRQLEDIWTVSDYNIMDGSTVLLTILDDSGVLKQLAAQRKAALASDD